MKKMKKSKKLPEVHEYMSPVERAYNKIRFSGLIVNKNDPKSIFFALYHMLMVNYLGMATVIDLIKGGQSLVDFVQSLGLIMIYLNNIPKSSNILINQKQIKELFARLDKFSLEITNDEAGKHIELRPRSVHSKFITIFSKLLMWLPPISLVTGLIADYQTDFVKPHLPFQLWLPWSLTVFWPYFAGMVFSTMIVVTTSSNYVSFTVLLFTFTTELNAGLRVLQHRLETNGPADKIIYKYHKEILELLHDYNRIFSGPVYLEILVSALQPCGFLYAFIKLMKQNDPATGEVIMKALLCIAAPFVPCSCGQTITTQMERLHASAYMGKWYEEKPKIRRDLVMLLTITTKRNDLNYKKFISYDFVCFATVIQGIYSYLMMIINFETD